jgi:hypothetical protein
MDSRANHPKTPTAGRFPDGSTEPKPMIEQFLDVGCLMSINGLPPQFCHAWLDRLGLAVSLGQPFLGFPTHQTPVQTISFSQHGDFTAHVLPGPVITWGDWSFDCCVGHLTKMPAGTLVVIDGIGHAQFDMAQGYIKNRWEALRGLKKCAEKCGLAIVVDHPGLESNVYALHELLVDTYLRFNEPARSDDPWDMARLKNYPGPDLVYRVSFRADYCRGDKDLFVNIQTGEVITDKVVQPVIPLSDEPEMPATPAALQELRAKLAEAHHTERSLLLLLVLAGYIEKTERERIETGQYTLEQAPAAAVQGALEDWTNASLALTCDPAALLAANITNVELADEPLF